MKKLFVLFTVLLACVTISVNAQVSKENISDKKDGKVVKVEGEKNKKDTKAPKITVAPKTNEDNSEKTLKAEDKPSLDAAPVKVEKSTKSVKKVEKQTNKTGKVENSNEKVESSTGKVEKKEKNIKDK